MAIYDYVQLQTSLSLHLITIEVYPPILPASIRGSEICGLSQVRLPSGNLLHSYGKSPFFMGKSTINGHFQ